MMRFADYVDINPRTPLTKGSVVPFVGMDAITSGRRKVIANEQREAKGSGAKFKPGDTLFARITPCLENGKIAQFSGEEAGMGSTEFFVLRAKTGLSDQDFVYYFALQQELRAAAEKSMSGATGRQRADISALAEFKCEFPLLPTQRRIAGILSAYDELIENNQRRIRILEDMARSLYREWFVHFRYPGHESVPLVDSILGDIPSGWQVKPLGEIADITMGLSPKGDTYNEDGNGIPLVNGPVEFGERFTKQVKWTTAPTKFCKEGDLIVCVRGSTTGKYVKSDGGYCLGRGVCGISSKYQTFVDLLFANELPTLLSQTGGSTFPSWTGPQLKFHPVLSPQPELLARFDTAVQPMSTVVFQYSRQVENLRRTRDLLLPRLLSGQVALDV